MNSCKTSFDPFADRLARDIRNELSTAFVRGLDTNRNDFYKVVAERYLAKNLPAVHYNYIFDRLDRYQKALCILAQNHISDPFEQSVVLWNNGLLFEVHERLETILQNVSGEVRQAIKGVIQAIAAYLHRQCGHGEVSLRLARKSIDLLRLYKKTLPASFNPIPIIVWLEQPGLGPPPRL